MCNFGNDYMRCKMINTGRLMFDRQLTDAGGGNISVRHNGLIYVTPMMAGEKLRWQLQPDDLIALDENTLEVVENDPTMMTRESMMHLGIYEAIRGVGAVLHAHPRYCLVYAAAKKRLDVYTENFEYFAGGPMECVKEVAGTSPELAKEVISSFYNRRNEIPERAVGALIPNHGIVIAAKDLDEAFTLLDNAEVNAMVGLFQKLL